MADFTASILDGTDTDEPLHAFHPPRNLAIFDGPTSTTTYTYRLSGAIATTTTLPLPTGAVVVGVSTS